MCPAWGVADQVTSLRATKEMKQAKVHAGIACWGRLYDSPL
jgi:hypothetical protein